MQNLAGWLSQRLTLVSWLPLAKVDNAPARFFACVVAALQKLGARSRDGRPR
jgi:ATP/maltotriose-dependent transcriptional regulator MalT